MTKHNELPAVLQEALDANVSGAGVRYIPGDDLPDLRRSKEFAELGEACRRLATKSIPHELVIYRGGLELAEWKQRFREAGREQKRDVRLEVSPEVKGHWPEVTASEPGWKAGVIIAVGYCAAASGRIKPESERWDLKEVASYVGMERIEETPRNTAAETFLARQLDKLSSGEEPRVHSGAVWLESSFHGKYCDKVSPIGSVTPEGITIHALPSTQQYDELVLWQPSRTVDL